MEQTFWVIRSVKDAEDCESCSLDNGIVGLSYGFMQDLSSYLGREDLKAAFQETYPNDTAARVRACAGALWRLKEEMKPGQPVFLPLRATSDIAVGRITGVYEYHPDSLCGYEHTRHVQWIRQDVRRSSLRPELLRQLNSYGALFTVTLSDEDQQAIGIVDAATSSMPPSSPLRPHDNLEADARDAIRKRISDRFKLHALEELVEDVLIAQGFQTLRKGPGPDSGVDVIASHGPMGLGNPRICVQVKSGDGRQGAPEVQQLLGALKQFQADFGLFVSWGGFAQPVIAAARQQFHVLRLWDQEQLIDAVIVNYEQLPQRSKDILRLRQIWICEPDEAE